MKPSSVTPANPRAVKRSRVVSVLSVVLPVLLTLLLIGQLQVWRQGDLPVPGFVVDVLNSRMQEQGLRVDFSEARLRLSGRIVISSPRFQSLTHPSLKLRADYLALQISINPFRKSPFRLKSLSLDGADLLCPAELSASGEQETPITDLNLRAAPSDRGWRIGALRFRAGETRAAISGELPLPPPPPPDVVPPTWEDSLIATARACSEARKEILDSLTGGVLRTRTQLLPEGRLGLRAHFFFDSLQHESGVRVDRGVGRAEFTLDPDLAEASGRLDLSAGRVDYQDEGHLINTHARIEMHRTPFSGQLPPLAVKVAAERLVVMGEPADNLFLEGRSRDEDRASLEAYLELDGRPVRGDADLDWRAGEGRVSLAGDANPTAVLRNPRLRETGFRFDVRFQVPPETEAVLLFGPDWQPREADMEVRAGACLIDGVKLDSALARARWIPGEIFDAHTMILRYDDFRVAGAYWNDLTNRDYRFGYHGTVRPKHISPWFGTWWENLWEPFEFAGAPPVAGIEISGRWKDDERIRVSGWAQATDLLLRDVPIDRMAARYDAGADWASVTDARIERPEGAAEGRFRHDRQDTEYITFSFTSDLDPWKTGRLLGNEAEHIAAYFTFETPPELQIEGRIFAPGDTGPHPRSAFTLHGRTGDPLTYMDIPFDGLSFRARLANSVLTIDPVEGGFAEGVFKGALTLDLGETEPRLSVRGELREAAFGEGAATLATRFTPETEEEAIENLRSLGGKVRISLDIEGLPQDLYSFHGPGKTLITEAELGQVRLLGPLSRLLDRTPFRFTSLQMNELESTFEMQGDKIHFPDMRLAGPNVGMEARGDYRLEDQSLDFRVKLFPLRESPMPLVSTIIGRVLEPFGHILEFSLAGTLEEPLWRLPMDPRRAFDEGEESPDRPRRLHGPSWQREN